MTIPPPVYTSGGSPPSYDEVAKKLEDLVGSDPTPDKVLNAAEKLSEDEINILVDGADDHWPLETEKQKEDFTIGCGKTLSSPEGRSYLENAGNEATQATRDIANIFSQLHLKIAQIDRLHQSGFEPEIIRLQQTYRGILGESREFATDISIQSRNFDRRIITRCADDTVPIEARRTHAENYIQTLSSLDGSAQGLLDKYKALGNDFGSFVASFSNWAKDREGEITEQIRVIEQELEDLHKRLFRMEASMRAFEVLFGASIPTTIKLSKAFPPFAKFIIIGGVITALASFATIAGLAAGISRTNQRIYIKNRDKERLQAELENIRRTRAELEEFGNDSLTQFETVIEILAGTWEQTIQDARVVQDWLVKGADAKHRPEYMELNRRHGVEKYEAMSVYLENYARGIVS